MGKQKKREFRSSNGITLIALVVSIIVMMVLAGVSINATIGDNGIIRKTKQASIQMGMAALEEWLQQEYVSNHDMIGNLDEQNKVEFLNRLFNHTLLLKDGTRDYIINDGRVYYLLDKECSFIPKEILQGLQLGNSKEYDEYTRLQDVYGITRDLKVYYCSNGLENVYGVAESYDIDPNALATGINNNTEIKNALTDILKNEYGIEIDSEKGVTLANVAALKNLEIDGAKYPGITDISALGDLKNLKTLTLSNLNLSNLKGLEGIPNLYYIYFKNTTVGDYTALASSTNLQYLYMYMPSTMQEETANNQVNLLGKGLSNADKLTKLEYFGISGDTIMFDDSIIKDMRNPTINTNRKNKLLWTSTNKSNVTDLNGLANFSENIKNSIKYVYLNNNKFSNVDALSEFKEIVELQLMCNANLNNVNGLIDHTKLNALTLQSSGLTNIIGLKGCTSLNKLSIQNNTGLTSLSGIDNSINLECLIANNCSITDIDALKNHGKVSYLKLANNVDLQSVKYIQHCKALNYIYLDNNEKMIGTELASALNGTDSSIGTSVLISNCANGYNNIPKKYWELFDTTATVLDYSYAALGTYLTNDSLKWVNLKGRTNVTKLKLDGQTQLTIEDNEKGFGINSTLKTMTGMKALSLKGCTQINSIDFVEPVYNSSKKITSGMPELYEIDLRSVNTSLTDLSAINGCIKLNRLIVNNKNIDATKIITAINRFRYESTTENKTWNVLEAWNCSGYVAENNLFPDLSNGCNGITSFYGGNSAFTREKDFAVLDFSNTSIIKYQYRNNGNIYLKLPNTCNSIFLDKAKECEFELLNKSNLSINFKWGDNTTLKKIGEIGITDSSFYSNHMVGNYELNNNLFESFSSFYLKSGDSGHGKCSFKNINKNGILKYLELEGMREITEIENLKYLIDLNTLYLKDCELTNINWIQNLVNLLNIDIGMNKIVNISALSNLKKLEEINLSNNAITDITPLVTAIGEDGVINYTELNIRNNSLDGYSVANNIDALLKLKAAGLQKVYITGNNFSSNEVNELINGKIIEGKTYAGFGAGNVIN